MKVGISALFDPQATAHARTLERALAVARDAVPGARRLTFDRVDDGATAEGAVRAAEELIGRGIDAVIGPFGSDAAVGALDLYVAAAIPVLLPAATVDFGRLPEGVFRLCPNDRTIAQAIVARIRHRGLCPIRVLCDDTSHYLKLRSEVEGLLANAGVAADETGQERDAVATVFLGRLEASRDWLAGFREKGRTEPVLFGDDAADPSVTRALDCAGEVEAVAFPDSRELEGAEPFAAHHRKLFGEEPAVYFYEVIAAVQLLADLAARRGPQTARSFPPRFDRVPTIFGPARFVAGENEGAKLTWKDLGTASIGPMLAEEASS